MLVAALEAEVAAYLEAHRDDGMADGHALVVRNGKGRTRKVAVGSRTIPSPHQSLPLGHPVLYTVSRSGTSPEEHGHSA